MIWPPKIGSRVKINAKGFQMYGCNYGNPKCKGTVRPSEHFTWVFVKWDDGSTNTYEEGTLDLVKVELENK